MATMATAYEYICPPCKTAGIMLADDEKSPGTLILLIPMDRRNEPRACPCCTAPLERTTVPETCGELWGNPYNKKKTCLGPSDTLYPPTVERKRRESMPTRHIDMSPRSVSDRREIRAEENRAPTASEVPKPGVSVPRS